MNLVPPSSRRTAWTNDSRPCLGPQCNEQNRSAETMFQFERHQRACFSKGIAFAFRVPPAS